MELASNQDDPHLRFDCMATGALLVGICKGDGKGAYVVGATGAVHGRLDGPASGGVVSNDPGALTIAISAQFQNCSGTPSPH